MWKWAAAGDPKDAPKPIAFTEGWVIGTPDKVFEIPTPVTVATSGTIDLLRQLQPDRSSGLAIASIISLAPALTLTQTSIAAP